MITEKIGLNAGRLWELLDGKGSLSIKEAKKKLKLTNQDLFFAIGWLTREEKLSFDDTDEIMISLK